MTRFTDSGVRLIARVSRAGELNVGPDAHLDPDADRAVVEGGDHACSSSS